MTRRLCIVVVAVSGLLAPLATHSQVVDVAGVKFEPSVQVGGTTLQLNGAGVRYKAIFKVYAAGLYLSTKAATPDAALAASGPKLLQIVMLREIDGNDLGKLFTKGLEQNVGREDFSNSINGILRMSEVFSARKKLAAGESFAVEWVPGTGTLIRVNGKPASEPIKEPEFYSSLMKIWLGNAPADAMLKEALLGKAAKVPGGNAND